MAYKDCIINLAVAPKEIITANSLIKKFKKKNEIEFDLKINLDYKMSDCGLYEDDIPGEIFVNPDLAVRSDNTKDTKDLKTYSGYIIDWSLLGITMHEFGHYLCSEVYDGIVDDYIEEFPINRLYLGEYSNENVYEEMAEIIRLYMLNPLLLKMIGENVYEYMKSWFKSPTPITQKYAVMVIEKFPTFIKEELKEKWKLVHNIHLNKIVKVVGDV